MRTIAPFSTRTWSAAGGAWLVTSICSMRASLAESTGGKLPPGGMTFAVDSVSRDEEDTSDAGVAGGACTWTSKVPPCAVSAGDAGPVGDVAPAVAALPF
ncbi:MAG: hypothetical protein ACJ8FO_09235 [Sphingomicrobium sp.]